MARPTSPVDISGLEQQKENVLPTIQGRSAAHLAAQFGSDRRSLDRQLKEGHAAFREELRLQELRTDEDAGDEDQLDVYHRYVKWTLSSYPSGPSHSSNLVPLLEEATRRFVKDARYRSDLRYLRLWILYAKYTDCPREIFRFLNANDIGTQMANMYEEWASAEETAKNFREADAVFKLGIARRAEPLNRLKRRRDAFQARMLLEVSAVGTSAPGSPEISSRTIPERVPPLVYSGSGSSQRNGHAFAVFSDTETANSIVWDDIGTVKSRKQENVLEAGSWTSQCLSLQGLPKASARIEVYRDENAPLPALRSSKPEVETDLVRGPTDADMLRRNPFRNYPEPVILGSSASLLKSGPSASIAATDNNVNSSGVVIPLQQFKSSAPVRERVALDLSAVYPADSPGTEYSPEELLSFRRKLRSLEDVCDTRAPTNWSELTEDALRKRKIRTVDRTGRPDHRQGENGEYGSLHPRLPPEPQISEQDCIMPEPAAEGSEPGRTCEERQHLTHNDDVERGNVSQGVAHVQITDAQALWPSMHVVDGSRHTSLQTSCSPTMNTKAAIRDVNDMFGTTLHFSDAFPSPSQHSTDNEAGLTAQEDAEDGSVSPIHAEMLNAQIAPDCSLSQSCATLNLRSECPTRRRMDHASRIDSSTLTGTPPADPPKLFCGREILHTAWHESPDKAGCIIEGALPAGYATYIRKPSRFAPYIDILTPLAERTLESTSFSRASSGITAAPLLFEQKVHGQGTEIPALGAVIDEDRSLMPLDMTSTTCIASSISTSGLEDATQPGKRFEAFSDGIVQYMMHTNEVAKALVDLQTTTSARSSHLKKVAKYRPRRSSSKCVKEEEETLLLELGDDFYEVREKLGEGAFGAVFRLVSSSNESSSNDIHGHYALKVQTPANLWEFCALQRVHERLDPDRACAVVRPERLYLYRDESYMLLELCDQGTLLDIVNTAVLLGIAPAASTVAAGATGLDEAVAIFFVIELLRAVEALHNAGFLHGDLKIDNCLVRLADVPGGFKAWSPRYRIDGSEGWSYQGIKIIDFGRSIDLRTCGADARFFSTAKIDPSRDCPEIVAGQDWTYEPDYHGVASIAFTLLLGRRLATSVDAKTNRVTVERGALRRYHQAWLWIPLFDALLNPRSCGELPIAAELRSIRRGFEDWLEVNSDTPGRATLRSLLRKIQNAALP